MGFVDILGWAAAAGSMVYALPQLVRLLQVRTSAGLSQLGWQLQVAVCLSWLSHGIIYSMPNQVLANSFTGVASVAVLVMLAMDRKQSVVRTLAPAFVGLAALIVVDFFLGQVVFGLVVVLPQTFAFIAQLRDLIKSDDFSGVSPLFLVVAMTVQSMWFSWSLLVFDPSVIIAAGMTVPLIAANLIVWAIRRRRVKNLQPSDE